MFLAGSPLKQRLETCRCFLRYSVLADAGQRRAVAVALERWLEQASDRAASLMSAGSADEPYIVAPQHHFLQSDFADSDPGDCNAPSPARVVLGIKPPPFPQGF
jgi:hypothetical protein